MTTDATAVSYGADARSGSREAIVPLGRFLFALIFVLSGLNNFSRQAMGYAASQGVPLASLLVPLSGILALAGGLSILLGYRALL
jgi:putative oxidoreductase